jgi:hypothetical protein
MIRITPGNLIATQLDGRYYYAVILDKVGLFGGNWTYVFHCTSEVLLSTEQLLGSVQPGFHAFVDFIWAKREDRLVRLAGKVDVRPYNSVQFLKATPHVEGKAKVWFIYNMSFEELKRVAELGDAERAYPLFECIDDTVMACLVEQRWTPEQDERI